MKKLTFILVLTSIIFACQTEKQSPADGEALLNLRYEEDYTPTWYEIIEMYTLLDKHYTIARLTENGMTDSGKPLHLFIIDKDRDFDPEKAKQKNKQILFVNNGIHPGEPCGIDASLLFADDLLRNKDSMHRFLDNTVICIVPVYNVGGCLYRSHFHRTNQPGPYESGYRGNAKNLDLNRDFVKADTENARSFARLFTTWKPHVFLDTHTTNGSDHQYCVTLIAAQHNSMQQDLGDFFSNEMVPELYQRMKQTDYDMVPYVMYTNRTPESGITNYVQTPKYSTGYTQLFNSLAFMTEHHCYKPYPDRVRSGYAFLKTLTEYTHDHGDLIREKRRVADEKIMEQSTFPLDYELDTSRYEMIDFKGYERGMVDALLTDEQVPGYDYSRPFTKQVPFFDHFRPVLTVEKPLYYIIPQAWSEVTERLKMNQVEMHRLSKDTTLTVAVYYIENHQWARRPDNGHFYHSQFDTRKEIQAISYYAGDYVVPVNQQCNQFIVNQLEPKGADSYFRWNFFDNIFENREWFSPHPVLERKMVDFMNKHPEIRRKLDQAIAENPDMENSRNAQMYFLYREVWENKWVNRYPVARVEQEISLPIMN